MVGDVNGIFELAYVCIQQESGDMDSGVDREGAASEHAEVFCERQLEDKGGISEVRRHNSLLDGVVGSRVVDNLGKDLVEQLSVHRMDLPGTWGGLEGTHPCLHQWLQARPYLSARSVRLAQPNHAGPMLDNRGGYCCCA